MVGSCHGISMSVTGVISKQTWKGSLSFVYFCSWHFSSCQHLGYHGGSPTAIQTWRTCPLWEPSPSHPIL